MCVCLNHLHPRLVRRTASRWLVRLYHRLVVPNKINKHLEIEFSDSIRIPALLLRASIQGSFLPLEVVVTNHQHVTEVIYLCGRESVNVGVCV